MISGQFLTLFTTFLLVFSGIALLVATFSIHNTFAIVVAQRTRENALLRALGASRRQVTASTLVEASAVAVVASAAGLAGGIGIAAGLQALFPAIGFPFPDGDLVISALSMRCRSRSASWSAWAPRSLPAVRAGRTAPLAALRETAVDALRRLPHAAPSPARGLARPRRRRHAHRRPGHTVRLAGGTSARSSPWSPSWSSARSPPRRPYGSSAAPSTGCAASPAASPGATPCAAPSGPPPPRAP